MTPEQRRLRAKIAANARWSRPFAREDQAAAASAALRARFEREADPDGTLPPEKLARLVKADTPAPAGPKQPVGWRERQAPCGPRARSGHHQGRKPPRCR
jgi:hypothetical protein